MMIQTEDIKKKKAEHQGAECIMHPECGCLTKSMHLADKILSTEGMIRYVSESNAKKFIVGTETGILHRLIKDHPDKEFIPAADLAVCSYMKMNTMEKIVDSLENLRYEVKVPEAIAKKARLPIERMLQIV